MAALMLQGTGSSVGKSLLVAGLCRAYAQRGLRVCPFKPQNMSNNAAVTVEGGEIGRAQALQARAARLAPSVDMNPVLLKPQSEVGAQVVVRGQVRTTLRARAYQDYKVHLLAEVLDSFNRLEQTFDLVLVEGAGSASEVNLRANDIANMGFACAANVPVVVVGDIDRGGVIAALVGTHSVLPTEDRACIVGFVVNRMRGDPTLFDAGRHAIAAHTGWCDFGLVPFFPAATHLPAEDALDLECALTPQPRTASIRIAVPILPHIANFDDLDPLAAEPDVALHLLRRGQVLPDCDLVILPGSKAVRQDLAALYQEGWDIDLRAHWRRGGRILGLCGGYQILGQCIDDPQGIEGPPGHSQGLGLLDLKTVLSTDKILRQVTGWTLADQRPFSGYEMHMGRTEGPDCQRPLVRFEDGRLEGALSADGRVAGTYVHGMLADDQQRDSWLRRLGQATARVHHGQHIDATLDALAAHLEQHMDLDALLAQASRAGSATGEV